MTGGDAATVRVPSWPAGVWQHLLLLRASREQIGEEDGLVAGRTGCARAELSAEESAVWTALLAEIAGLAGGALVDRGGSRCPERQKQREHSMPPAPGRLATGCRADPLAPHGAKSCWQIGQAIVTPTLRDGIIVLLHRLQRLREALAVERPRRAPSRPRGRGRRSPRARAPAGAGRRSRARSAPPLRAWVGVD